MFAETIIYQILSWVFPSIRMWPDRLFAFMVEVYAESLSLVGLQNTRWYDWCTRACLIPIGRGH
jgi:lipase ATG15